MRGHWRLLLAGAAFVVVGVAALGLMHESAAAHCLRYVSTSTETEINGRNLTAAEANELIDLIRSGQEVYNDDITETTPDYVITMVVGGQQEYMSIFYLEYIAAHDAMRSVVRVDKERMAKLIDGLHL